MYKLTISAGPSYDRKDHQPVVVNAPDPEVVQFRGPHCSVQVAVRVKEYQASNLHTHEYFKLKTRQKNQISIQFSIVFDHNVNGDDLLWGNDFDQSIRKILPPGFGLAMNIMKWTIDPSIEAKPFIDRPYVYGRALVSLTAISIGRGVEDELEKEQQEEQETQSNESEPESTPNQALRWPGFILQDDLGLQMDSRKRSKYFLSQSHRSQFTFQQGVQYNCDFFTPYISMGKEFAVVLPGFKVNVERRCGTQPLRFVLKNRASDEVYLALYFDLSRA